MNEDDNNLQPWIEPELEARVVAWVLGEASAFEAAELERLLAEKPELAIFKRRIEAVHGLVTEAERPEKKTLRLSPGRRQKLLEAIGAAKAPAPESKIEAFPWPAAAWLNRQLLLRVAACVIVVGAAAGMFVWSVAPLWEKTSIKIASATALPEKQTFGTSREVAVADAKPSTAATPLPSGGSAGGESRLAMGDAAGTSSASRENVLGSDGALQEAPAEGFAWSRSNVAGGPVDDLFSAQTAEPALIAGSRAAAFQNEEEALDRVAELTAAPPASAPLPSEPEALNETLTRQGSTAISSTGSEAAEAAVQMAFVAPAPRQDFAKVEHSKDSPSGNFGGVADAAAAPADQAQGAVFIVRGAQVREEPATRGDAGIRRKLAEIKIPSVNFREATVREALDYIKARAAALDAAEPDPSKRGIDVALKLDPTSQEAAAAQRITLQLTDVPLGEALRYIATAANLKTKIEPYAVAVVPLNDTTDVLVTKEYKVSPDFISSLPLNEAGAAATGPPAGGVSGVAEKSRAKEFLETLGISFPAGATANYLPRSGKLIVRNTQENLDLIDALVDTAAANPISVNALDARVDLLSASEVTTKSGQEATVSVVREFKYPTRFDAPQIPQSIPVAKQQPLPANDELKAAAQPFSTFSLHVADVSFLLAKDALEKGAAPDPEKIRTEEFYNAFDYGDPAPASGEKIAARIEQSAHPFLQQRNLVRIAMKVASAGRNASQPLRLTILLDTSGSMERDDRAASVRRALASLASLLGANDRVTLIGFAREPRLLAEEVPGDQAGKLVEIAARTPSDGGTNLEEALGLAEELAVKHRVPSAQNRVVLLTDGAANLGNADPAQLARRVEKLRQQRIAFDACGVGADGLNDGILEALTRKGDGRYYFLNQPADADEGFARQLAGAFRPAAENVKIQVRFNPARVGKYKLLGFEEHRLRKQDFRNDKVDAAELSAAEAGVALYQVEPLPEGEGELGEAFIRFRDPATGAMVERSWTIPYDAHVPAFDRASSSMQLAGVAAMLAEKLRGGPAADAIDLEALAPVVNELRSDYPRQARVRELVRMFEQMTR